MLIACACSGEILGPGTFAGAPRLGAVSVAANPYNVLSAVVTCTARYTDSVRILYDAVPTGGGSAGAQSATPFFKVKGDSARILVLGLKPNAAYTIRVEGAGNGADTSTSVSYHTADLPQELLGVRLVITGHPGTGYTLTELTREHSGFLIAFDSLGEIAWYRGFATEANEMALDAEQRANGDYTLFIGASTGWQPTRGRFVEVTAAGDIVREYEAGRDYYTDPHELVLSFRGDMVSTVHLFGYDLREMDLSKFGGRSEQLVAGHSIVRLSAEGVVEFLWSAWDHFSLDDWLFVPPRLAQMESIDFDHPNSLDLDLDGNYVASFASLGTVVKIDRLTGQLLWRFGGRKSDFKVVGDPLGGFGSQHDVRVLPNGDLLLFDNGLAHFPRESRAVEYRLDLSAKTATMVWEYRHDPPLFAAFAGSAQRLANGSTLVAFGAKPQMAEVAIDGTVTWEGQLTVDGQPVPFMYRATHVAALVGASR